MHVCDGRMYVCVCVCDGGGRDVWINPYLSECVVELYRAQFLPVLEPLRASKRQDGPFVVPLDTTHTRHVSLNENWIWRDGSK